MNTQIFLRNCALVLVSSLVTVSGLYAQSTAQPAPSQQPAQSNPSERMTVMDGAAGPCTILLTVSTEDGKPVYDSTVKVHMAYGIAGVKKLDMEAGTNISGRVKFIGIPPRVHKAPLVFKATKDQFAGSVDYDPLTECDASKSIVLKKSAEQ
ncbi:MAG TPA: hypothetical protein VMU24_01245 [Candidatus Acidoferrales bacterium]|nr:hypothetical protein [Candidatus Acidoferrales bacterium]